MTDTDHKRRHFGRRKGWKLRPRQSALIDTLLPHLSLKPEFGLAPENYFSVPLREVWFEIGFGGGEHLAAQAQANPDVGIIGAEPFVAGMAKLLGKIEDLGVTNIRVYSDDARDILAALPDASLGKIFILFPDPWPKNRHHKRRFIQTHVLDELARVLRKGGELRFASDDAGYVSWALECFMAHPDFEWSAKRPSDWRIRPADWPATRYETKAVKAGRACVYLQLVRK
jgi:tRNA (guanine-N7-)-methyltransferase